MLIVPSRSALHCRSVTTIRSFPYWTRLSTSTRWAFKSLAATVDIVTLRAKRSALGHIIVDCEAGIFEDAGNQTPTEGPTLMDRNRDGHMALGMP